MTDKEVIKLAQGLITDFKCESDTMMDFCNTVIEKFEQQPCDDCVSRKAVNKLKKYRLSYDTNTTIPKADIFVKISDIAGLPSVKPSRPKGKWIPIHPLQEDDDGAYICSNCEYGDWDCDTIYKYCPFCGAQMNGGGEDEND